MYLWRRFRSAGIISLRHRRRCVGKDFGDCAEGFWGVPWSPERLATTTPRTTVASVRCRSRTPPTRKLTTLQMAVTAITFLHIPRSLLTLKWSFRDVLHIIRSQSAACYLCSQSSKQRRRSCIAASLWQLLHLRSSAFLPRRASPPPAAELVRRPRRWKSCRPKAGRRASATACTVCPARAGAISAILPATATDWSRRSRVRRSPCGKERGWWWRIGRNEPHGNRRLWWGNARVAWCVPWG